MGDRKPLDVMCVYCGSKPGAPCIMPDSRGRMTERERPHAHRVEAAQRAAKPKPDGETKRSAGPQDRDRMDAEQIAREIVTAITGTDCTADRAFNGQAWGRLVNALIDDVAEAIRTQVAAAVERCADAIDRVIPYSCELKTDLLKAIRQEDR